jgi:hypothetical protein
MITFHWLTLFISKEDAYSMTFVYTSSFIPQAKAMRQLIPSAGHSAGIFLV